MQNTESGAAAFVRHYIALANFALTTGITADLAGLSASACDSCRRFALNVAEIYADGGRTTGGACSIRQIKASALDAYDWQVGTICRYAPQLSYDPSGKVTRTKGKVGALVFTVHFAPNPEISSWSLV